MELKKASTTKMCGLFGELTLMAACAVAPSSWSAAPPRSRSQTDLNRLEQKHG